MMMESMAFLFLLPHRYRHYDILKQFNFLRWLNASSSCSSFIGGGGGMRGGADILEP